MYAPSDSIVQVMDTCDQDLSAFKFILYQFAFKNELENNSTIKFKFYVNGYKVNSITINPEETPFYHVKQLVRIPKQALSKEFHKLTLTLSCASLLSFGSGFVTISKIGRVLFLKEAEISSFNDQF